ncbi:MAG TPA: hypothetical protein VIM29_13680 [Bacillota bacterium]
MKKILIIMLLLACSIGSVASAGPPRRPPGPPHRGPVKINHDSREKVRARNVLRETNVTLERAQIAARRGNYRNGLGRAFSHQQEARDLYRRGRYDRAIAHSLRARDIANDVIRANNDPRYRRSRIGHDYNRHDDLDNSIRVRLFDDNVALKIRINLD